MKRTNILLGILTILIGIAAMVSIYFGFKYLPLQIQGDKFGMCLMFEAMILVLVIFISGSFFCDATKDQTGTRRNR